MDTLNDQHLISIPNGKPVFLEDEKNHEIER
jgi:hypothetical protein